MIRGCPWIHCILELPNHGTTWSLLCVYTHTMNDLWMSMDTLYSRTTQPWDNMVLVVCVQTYNVLSVVVHGYIVSRYMYLRVHVEDTTVLVMYNPWMSNGPSHATIDHESMDVANVILDFIVHCKTVCGNLGHHSMNERDAFIITALTSCLPLCIMLTAYLS